MSSILNSKTIDQNNINKKNLVDEDEIPKSKKQNNNVPNKDNILQYKGIHFKQEKQLKLYEHGAHFKYQELYNILNSLVNKQELEIGSTNHSSVGNLNSLIEKNEGGNNNNNNHNNKNFHKNKNDNNDDLEGNNKESFGYNKYTKENKTFVNNHKLEKNSEDIHNSNYKTQLLNKKSKTLDKNIDLIEANKNRLDLIKSNILPPINKKIENLEYVKSKIDTGIKGSAIKKVDQENIKVAKMIEKNLIPIDNVDSEKAKKFKIFNENITNIFSKSPNIHNNNHNLNSNHHHNSNTNINKSVENSHKINNKLKPIDHKQILSSSVITSNINPNSLNSIIKNMTKASNIKISNFNK